MLQLCYNTDTVWAFHTTAHSERISCILYWFYSPAGTQSCSRYTSQQGVQSDIPCTAAAPETAPRRGSAGGTWCRRRAPPCPARAVLTAPPARPAALSVSLRHNLAAAAAAAAAAGAATSPGSGARDFHSCVRRAEPETRLEAELGI